RRLSVPAASPSCIRLRRGLRHLNRPSINEHVPHPSAIEQVTVDDDHVGDLALLERAHAIGGAGELRGAERQRAQDRVGGKAAFLDHAAGVANEVRGRRAARGERESDAALRELRGYLGRIGRGLHLTERLTGATAAAATTARTTTAARAATTRTGEVDAENHTRFRGRQLRAALTGAAGADDDRVEAELGGHRKRAVDLARFVDVEGHRHLLRERRLERIERRLDDRTRALRAGALVLRLRIALPLRVEEPLLRERDRAQQRAWVALAAAASRHVHVHRDW